MRPTLRQLQYFVAVADYNAFGAAAHALAVSQPSLSKQLAIMEEELGSALFERTSRRVTLTPLGRLLLDRARVILKEMREFRAIAKGSIGLFGDRLSIGVLPSIGAYFMPIANRRLHQLFPDLRLVVQEGATVQLLELLHAGKVDAVIGTPHGAPELQSIPLFAETLWICAASDDPLSRETTPVTTADLKGRPLLALSPEFKLADVVERLAAEAGAYVSHDYQGGSLDAVRQMAVMGAGVAVLPSLYALAEAVRDPEFVVRRIDHPLAVHEIALHWRRASPLRADFEQLAAQLIEVKQEIRQARAEQFGS
ncbi:Hydrogen peroxide-inducible genes activator [Roseobacter fucihabitans]|uniref:Hydrogen peroxide-inducible genes activator n=1 Tax=Roseobacter fucihabitans TaxID=1537242 RepID=A0ABZ2C072_9RHOB|nr:LysR substrate-binding domain-containing protein [Roseobacter litoralis]MBC6965893.1 Hydrogen peroxide-inducible genes activator [Roseobacter litoralis]